MNHLRAIGHRLTLLALTTVFWVVQHGTALAQPTKQEPKEASWVMSYMLVLLGAGLGLLVVLRSSRRRDRPKIEKFADGEDEEE